MAEFVRLDKYLADMSVGTRSQVKALVNKGKVKIDGVVVKDSGVKIDIESQRVEADGKSVSYCKYEYFMLNKPQGVVSATEDLKETTVVELIKDSRVKNLFPVGRLDKDTEGLLIITNDGELSHRLLSPKNHVEKTYYVETDIPVTKEGLKRLENGVDIGDEKLTMPARAEAVSAGVNRALPGDAGCVNGSIENAYYITICEGRFHQVKRMFKTEGAEVTFLKRMSVGKLLLDESLAPGEYRRLTERELELLKE